MSKNQKYYDVPQSNQPSTTVERGAVSDEHMDVEPSVEISNDSKTSCNSIQEIATATEKSIDNSQGSKDQPHFKSTMESSNEDGQLTKIEISVDDKTGKDEPIDNMHSLENNLISDKEEIHAVLSELYDILDINKNCQIVSHTNVNNESSDEDSFCCAHCDVLIDSRKLGSTNLQHYSNAQEFIKHLHNVHSITINLDSDLRWQNSWTHVDDKQLKYFNENEDTIINCRCLLCGMPLEINKYKVMNHLKKPHHIEALKLFIKSTKRLPNKYIKIMDPKSPYFEQVFNPHELMPGCCCRRINCAYCPQINSGLRNRYSYRCKYIKCTVCNETFPYQSFNKSICAHSTTEKHHTANMNYIMEKGLELPISDMIIPIKEDLQETNSKGSKQKERNITKKRLKRGNNLKS